jgi:hypothetical protein
MATIEVDDRLYLASQDELDSWATENRRGGAGEVFWELLERNGVPRAPAASRGAWRVVPFRRFVAGLPSVEPGFDIGSGKDEAVGREGLEVRVRKCPREPRRGVAAHYLSQHSPCEGQSCGRRLAPRSQAVVVVRPNQPTNALADQVQLGSEDAPSSDE